MKTENKNGLLVFLLPELLTVLVGSAGVYGLGIIARQLSAENALRDAVMTALGFAVAGFFLRRETLDDHLDYDNADHPIRFWIVVWCCLLFSLACVFLPAGGWPFPAVFVVLSLFGNLPVGILFSSVFLMIAAFEGQSAGIFFLYFISGIFAACLFQHLEEEFSIAVPLFLSLLCLLLCETANIVLLTNEHLTLEQFLVPAANLIISGILLLGILKIFSGMVVYKDRVRYLDLNDTENQTLSQYRKTDRAEYFLCIHTAYFCERIAVKLGMDKEALKCAGLYHKKCWDQMTKDGVEFPKVARTILEEYKTNKNYHHRETVVLYCSDAIVSAVLLLLQKEPDKKPDYDQVIDKIFEHIWQKEIVSECDMTLHDWKRMQKIFKEEKLYYDFLR